MDYTEAPVGQGRIESPWEGLEAGVIMGSDAFAQQSVKRARVNSLELAETNRLARAGWMEWPQIVQVAEKILGHR